MLLDEPFANIDRVLRRRLRGELRRILKDSGAATLFVTHDPEEALDIGDRIAIMKGGRIIEAASPQTLFEEPKTPEGASLFPGAQHIDGVCEGGAARTPFGTFRAKHSEGPVVVIAMPGAARLEPSPNGRALVVGSRFAGPGWLVELSAEGAADRLCVPSPEAPEIGRRFDVAFDERLVRVFPRRA
jgi:iron(III) transport system ATP-binding protein